MEGLSVQLCEVPAFYPRDWILLPSNDFLLLRSAGNIYNDDGGKEPNLIMSTDTGYFGELHTFIPSVSIQTQPAA